MILKLIIKLLSTPFGIPLIFWSVVAFVASIKGWRWFGWFFGFSALILVGGAIFLIHYASDPSVDGDGTTLFGAVFLIMGVGAYSLLVFLICAIVAVIRAHHIDKRTQKLEQN